MIESGVARLVAVSVRRPWTVLAIAAVAIAAAAALVAGRLELRTSNLDLVSPDLPEVRRFTRFAEEFGTPNVLVVVLEGGGEEALGRAVDRAGPLLARAPGVRSVVDRLPFPDEVLEQAGLSPWLLSDDGRMAFVLVQPKDERSSADTIASFVESAREALRQARLDELGVRAGLTGMPAYALDDRDVLRRDISRLSGAAAVLELLLLVLAFGSFWRPLLAVGTLLASLVLVFGAASLWPGHLTLLSSFFVSIAFGEGVDFAIHVFGRVQELMATGLSEREALPLAAGRLARSMVTTVATTSAVFLAMTCSGFRGFEELGAIAAMTLPACLLTSLTVLPAALSACRLRPPRPGSAGLVPFRRWMSRRRHPVLAAALACAALGSLLLGAPGFDRNYLNLEPEGSEAVRLELAMVASSPLSPNFAAFTAASREEAAALTERLLREDVVGEVASLADLEELAGEEDGEALQRWRRSFVSPAGRHAVYAHPEGDAWQPEVQARFVRRMRAIDPEVTGMPFLGSFMVDRSLRALRITAGLAVVIVFACAAISFRSVPLTLVAGLATVLTVAGLQGVMRLIGMPWNPLNVMALPIVVGYAVDDSVHVIDRFLAERGDVAATLHGAGGSITLTTATTLVSFGALTFTGHRGLASFATALTVGVALALVMASVVLPPVLQRLSPRLLKESAP